MNQQQYPLEGIAEQLASQGRYGDTMLMHVNPAEVEGIASLIPGGQLPRNPMTGQPEAFIGMILGMLAKPLLTKGVGALAGAAGKGALGTALSGLAGSSAAMTGITSGLIETARTGDIKKGFASGLMGAGIGKALGAASDAMAGGPEAIGAVDAAKETVADATKNLSSAKLDVSSLEGLDKLNADQISGLDLAYRQQDAATKALADAQSQLSGAKDDLLAFRTPDSVGDAYRQSASVFKPEGFKAAAKTITSPEAFLPLAVGASYGAELDYQDAMDAEGRRMEEEKAAEEQYSRDLMERSFEQIRQDYPEMDNQYNPYAYAQGGIVSIDPTQYAQTLQGLSDVAGPIDMNAGGVLRMDSGGPASIYGSSPSGAGKGSVGGGRGSPQARNRQAKIRGTDLVAPAEGYRPGFDPEHRFFQNLEKVETDANQQSSAANTSAFGGLPFSLEDGTPQFAADPYMNVTIGQALSGLTPQFLGAEGIDPKEFMTLQKRAGGLGRQGLAAKKKLRGLREKQAEEFEKAAAFETEMAGIAALDQPDDFKGRVQEQQSSVMENPYLSQFDPSMYKNQRFMQEGGITEVAAQEQMAEQPAPEDAQLGSLIEQAAMAVLGQVSEEEAEIIINRFIDEFGQEAFQMLREQVLQGVVPEAQTQGLIEGEGGGMDDQVQGMIGDQQRVAVSPGEFIVPADVVSGLGDGDTDAGADELDAMMDRVRVERTGTVEQPPRLSAGGLLPA